MKGSKILNNSFKFILFTILCIALFDGCVSDSERIDEKSTRISFILNPSNSRIVTPIVVDSESKNESLTIIINIDPITTIDIPNHNFALLIKCSESGTVLKNVHFTTFPLGNAGQFVYRLQHIDLCSIDDQAIRLGLDLHVDMETERLTLNITGNIEYWLK